MKFSHFVLLFLIIFTMCPSATPNATPADHAAAVALVDLTGMRPFERSDYHYILELLFRHAYNMAIPEDLVFCHDGVFRDVQSTLDFYGDSPMLIELLALTPYPFLDHFPDWDEDSIATWNVSETDHDSDIENRDPLNDNDTDNDSEMEYNRI